MSIEMVALSILSVHFVFMESFIALMAIETRIISFTDHTERSLGNSIPPRFMSGAHSSWTIPFMNAIQSADKKGKSWRQVIDSSRGNSVVSISPSRKRTRHGLRYSKPFGYEHEGNTLARRGVRLKAWGLKVPSFLT